MVQRYQHPIFALQYELSEGREAHLGDVEWYTERLGDLGGPVLELGAGTGRVTVPLAAAGLTVIAIDIGTPMLRLLKKKASATLGTGATRVRLVCGDMTQLPLRGRFAAAFSAYNSLACVLRRGALRRCFREVHRRLGEDAPWLFDIAVHRPEDYADGPKTFDWSAWTTDDGQVIRRRVSLRNAPEKERLEHVYTYRWKDSDGAPQERTVNFALNTFPPEDYVRMVEESGFRVRSVEEKTFAGREGQHRMWVFIETRRR